jgi:hypothetical protein
MNGQESAQNVIKYFESINKPSCGFIRIIEKKDGSLTFNCIYKSD